MINREMRAAVLCGVFALLIGATVEIAAQPTAVAGGVAFTYADSSATSVSVAGDFNSWSKDETPLAKDAHGRWSARRAMAPGIYQYKFVIDGARYETDSRNPVTVPNYNNSAPNSVFVYTDDGRVLLSSDPPSPPSNLLDLYPPAPGKGPVYLNIIWHQHQPLYANPTTDQLAGPWVRTHATKDYYDMAAVLREYPDIHCTINLTSSLLLQLRHYYIDRLKPFIDTRRNRMDVAGFLRKWKGKTDPWIDLALKNTASFDRKDRDYLYRDVWNAFGMSDVQIARFPEYRSLRDRIVPGAKPGDDLFTEQELREIKFWFYLAHFDPDFLTGPVTLTDGSVCDLSSYVEFRPDSTFRLKRRIREADCVRMVVEATKVMANVIPVHSSLAYDPAARSGQVEIITTPYYHPILPLIYDSDLARVCQPRDSLPPRFSFPQDANAQIAKAVALYRGIFGRRPTGMWPGEGSVAQPVLRFFRDQGIEWTASDVKVLNRSDPPNRPNTDIYRFPAGDERWLSLVFRDTELSDRIGFKYQNYSGEEAAEDFLQSILARAPERGEPDLLVTVILDGENAWEWYRKDIDGKEFIHAFYRKLSALYAQHRIVTTTPIEYIRGNDRRGISPHPVATQPAMNGLWPGSWINANYDTWIGEREENRAWEYLLKARTDLARSSLPQPDPLALPPKEKTKAWYAYKAWEEMYAAEGSDWFWWYGDDQSAPGGDTPFDQAYRTHLENIYVFARRAGATMTSPGFAPIISDDRQPSGSQGVMAQSQHETRTVLFTCDATDERVPVGIYITGNLPQLGAWKPNSVPMRDDGRGGDDKAGDGVWTLTVDLPVGVEIQYKYSNSGKPGVWTPGEEFPVRARTMIIPASATGSQIVNDKFGR